MKYLKIQHQDRETEDSGGRSFEKCNIILINSNSFFTPHPFIVHNGTMDGVSFHTKLMLGSFLCMAWFNQWPVVESDKSYFWAQDLEKIIWLCLPFYVFCHLPWAEQVPEWDMSGEVYLYLTCFLKPDAQTDPQMWEQEHIHLLSELLKFGELFFTSHYYSNNWPTVFWKALQHFIDFGFSCFWFNQSNHSHEGRKWNINNRFFLSGLFPNMKYVNILMYISILICLAAITDASA